MNVPKELEFAIYLMGSGGEPHPGVDMQKVLATLKANKVPLLMIERQAIGNNHDLPVEFMEHIQREREAYSIKRNTYSTVRKAFSDEGIHDILFKSSPLFPYFPYTSGNIDILTKPEFVRKARTILHNLAFVELKNTEEPQKFLFKKFEGARETLAVHLHGQVGWDVAFLDNGFIWNGNYFSPEDDPLLSIPSPELSLLVTLAHTLYEDKEISLLDLAKFDSVRGAIDWDEAAYEADKNGWLDGFCFFFLLYTYLAEKLFNNTHGVSKYAVDSATRHLRRSPAFSYLNRLQRRTNIEMPFRISFLFSKTLHFKKIFMDKQQTVCKKMRDMLHTLLWGVQLKLRIHSQPGMLIAFSGVDGSGKTSQANLLGACFKQCGIKIKQVWNRSGCSCFAGFFTRTGKSILRLFGYLDSRDTMTVSQKINVKRTYLERTWIRFLWYSLILAELTALYSFKVRIPLFLGRVVICDRYTLDAIAEISSYNSDTKRLEALFGKILVSLNPKPDLYFCIDIPSKIAMKRTEGEDEDHLRRQVSIYRKLNPQFQAFVIKGDASREHICDIISYRTLEHYYRDFHTFVRTIFLSNPSQLNSNRKAES